VLLPAELDRVRIVLVAARNPLNIGAAARAMSNFGFRRMRVVNSYDLAFRDARSAVGAADLLATAEQCESVAEAVADCQLVVGTTAVGRRELDHPLQRLEAGARLIRVALAETKPKSEKKNVALLFGSEKRGLSNEDLSHCDWLMHIPTRAGHLSMNLGQAVAICLYELIRDSEAAPLTSADEPAAAGELERVATVMLNALLVSGYTAEERKVSTEQILRRLLHRAKLGSGDMELLLGMLRQILWKARQADRRKVDEDFA
jgi:TrmH family RNA methyltransferase